MSNGLQSQEEITLSRTLGLLDITMIGVGAMIGAGIFVLTGIAAGEAGPALVLAFLLNGITTTFTALSYAELGSAFPEAGGGYLWVKEGMGGTQGFLAGWMSWFAHAVACSLYGLGFGRFAVELLSLGYPGVLDHAHSLTLLFMGIIVILFAFINVRGASETGLVGNVVTIAKVIILGIFIVVGVRAMFLRPDLNVFTENFLPHGLSGVFVAMGLTFIAFEGYEIIAQSGEEVKDPMRNIPRAIFISIVIVVIIYVLVALVAIGAVTVPANAGNIPVWDYLAQAREVAIVRAAEQFMGRWGGILILISGLASTMSALNATIYSSSRVSFAMGRDHNLPDIFGRIHPRMHTPFGAIGISAVLIIIMALSLPIDQVAKAADVMFLLMFAQVNITLMTLRRRRPDLERGYRVPLFPWPALIGIVTNMALAIFLAVETGRVGIITIAWIAVGMMLYWGYFKNKEQMERPHEVLHREALVSVNYSVLVPVADEAQASQLGRLGSILAREHRGEVLALNVIKVPATLQLSDGRYFLKERRPIVEHVIAEARQFDVPVHTVIRLGRSVSHAIVKTVAENASDMLLFGWPGTSSSNERLFGSVIDHVIANPPTDIAILRSRPFDKLHRILVPVAGGPNSRLALSTAIALARNTPESSQIVLMHVTPPNMDTAVAQAQAENAFRYATNGSDYAPIDKKRVEASSPLAGILREATSSDIVVMGATSEPLFRNLLVGSITRQVADEVECPVLIVKRRSSPVAAVLRETILPPVVRNE
ncbi:MAG: amino acid permease [Anaerolineales bacterium]|nr:amino acid permease [Anaerolineales bacterium]MCB8952572.1 amino acid permease [Ardenticatenales bacterium]